MMISGAFLAALSQVTLTIYPDRVIRRDLDQLYGINLNFLKDSDVQRPGATPLSAALRSMGVKWLRYPGGEKSDYHRWAEPPYTTPKTVSLKPYDVLGGSRMTIDDAAQLAHRTGSRLHFVVAYDSIARVGQTEEELMEHAVSWVRYAKKRGWRGVQWEIGNENWHNGTATPKEMAAVVGRFASAMRQADPGVRLVASGRYGWWDEFLPLAAPHLDAISVSQYNGWEWKSYDRFLRDPEPDLTEGARQAQEAILRLPNSKDRERLEVVVAETNTKDYSPGGWPDRGDIGHALPTFASLGKLAEVEKVKSVMIWNTRWVDDQMPGDSMWHALDHQNRPTATGWALRMFAAHAHPLLIPASSSDRRALAFASLSREGKKAVVWIVNRSGDPAPTSLQVSGALAAKITKWERVAGTSPTDTAPKWSKGEGTEGALLAPPYSITAVHLQLEPKPTARKDERNRGELSGNSSL
jgi:alpha-L-arabinofuranosidase